MNAVFFGLGCFATAMLIHVAIWRIHMPKATMRALAILFAGVYLTAVVIGTIVLRGIGVLDYLYGGVLYASMALCYWIFYTGLEYDSPTLSLVLFMFKHRQGGVTEEQLRKFMESRPFVRSRLNQMYRDGFIRNHGEWLELIPKSSFMLRICDYFRTVMHRETSGG